MSQTKLSSYAILFASLLTAPAALAQFNGTYTGQVENDRAYAPIITKFKTDEQGRIGGSYQYTQNKHRYSGSLNDCEYNGSVNLRCVWREGTGEGVVTFAFGDEFQRFMGLWKSGFSDEVYGWGGEKRAK